MAKGKDQHVVPRDKEWAVRGEGNKRDTSHHRTQKDAIDSARNIAKKQRSEVVIHRRDGKIRDSESYGNDPHPAQGQEALTARPARRVVGRSSAESNSVHLDFRHVRARRSNRERR